MNQGIEQAMRATEKLLEDFDRGKISRRQLIQTLSLAACAAAVSPSAKAAGKQIRVSAVNHISYQVPDYGKIRDFYSDLFGMKVSQDDGKQCYLTFGPTTVIARKGKSPRPQVDHIAYAVEDWNKNDVEAELNRRGLKPRTDQDSFHIHDPAGFDVQIARPGFLTPLKPQVARNSAR